MDTTVERATHKKKDAWLSVETILAVVRWAPQYGGALLIPVVSGVGKTVTRVAKRKVQGLAKRIVDRATGALTKRAKRGGADLLGV